jgi:hypothetical protein
MPALNTPAAATATQGAKAKSNRAPSAKWSNQEVARLIKQLQECKSNGQTSENGFKTSVWNSIAVTFTDPLKQAGRTCESKWTRLKKDYKEVKFLREASGFGWDSVNNLVTTEPEVWAEMAKVIASLFL